MSVKAKKSIKTSKQDTLFYAVIYAVILLILIILLWPLIFIVSSSSCETIEHSSSVC